MLAESINPFNILKRIICDIFAYRANSSRELSSPTCNQDFAWGEFQRKSLMIRRGRSSRNVFQISPFLFYRSFEWWSHIYLLSYILWPQYFKKYLFSVNSIFFFLYWIISSLIPRHTSENSSDSFQGSDYRSLFFYRFYHIFATRRDMFTIGRFTECFRPNTMIRGEILLVESYEENNKSFHIFLFSEYE